MNTALVQEWTQVETFAELCELRAQQLKGNLLASPIAHQLSGLDPGASCLAPILASVSRAGGIFLERIQVGCTPVRRPLGGSRAHQRAAISGFTSDAAVDRLIRMCADLGCVDMTLSVPGLAHRKPLLGSTMNTEGQIFVDFGQTWDSAEIAQRYGPVRGLSARPGLHPHAIAALRHSCQFSVVDRVWGDNRLWGALAYYLLPRS
jgi:hypothetical protein